MARAIQGGTPIVKPIAVCGLALGLLGCSSAARTCDLESSAIVLFVTITDDEHGVEVELELEAGGQDSESAGAPLTVCSDAGEQLKVNGVGAQEVRVLGQVYYVVEFDEPVATYTIEFVREKSTIVTELAMPPTIEITSPAEDTVIPRSEPIAVAWTPTWPDHPITVGVEDQIGSDCLAGLGISEQVDDVGAWMIVGNALEAGPGSPLDATCKAWVALSRSSVGTYPSELHEGGSVLGYVKRRVRFLSSG